MCRTVAVETLAATAAVAHASQLVIAHCVHAQTHLCYAVCYSHVRCSASAVCLTYACSMLRNIAAATTATAAAAAAAADADADAAHAMP
jgi:hypothetical protein